VTSEGRPSQVPVLTSLKTAKEKKLPSEQDDDGITHVMVALETPFLTSRRDSDIRGTVRTAEPLLLCLQGNNCPDVLFHPSSEYWKHANTQR
jgi:hypothetical protein